MMRDWNVELFFSKDGAGGAWPGAPSFEAAARFAFWGGVVAWPGLFSLLAVSFAARAVAPDVRRSLLRRARRKRDPACAPASLPKRRVFGAALFCAYFVACCAWTKAHPVHDAMFFGSYKLRWGVGNPALDAPLLPYFRRADISPKNRGDVAATT